MDATDRTLDGRRDAAITAAAAAIEERLRLYGNDPAAGSIGWGASPRELAALAYDAIITGAAETLSATFLAERDLDPKHFVRIRGRHRNPDYNAGYRMGMEDAARYARGDYVPASAGPLRPVTLAERAADVALGNPSRDSSRYQEWIAKPDSTARRAELGHRFEPDVPGYCTCGELVHEGTY